MRGRPTDAYVTRRFFEIYVLLRADQRRVMDAQLRELERTAATREARDTLLCGDSNLREDGAE